MKKITSAVMAVVLAVSVGWAAWKNGSSYTDEEGESVWPPGTFPRPSENPRPAGLVIRLRGG